MFYFQTISLHKLRYQFFFLLIETILLHYLAQNILSHQKHHKRGSNVFYQVGGNDDIIFDGNSFATNKRGAIVCKAKKFEEDVSSISEEKLEFHAIGVLGDGLPYCNTFESNEQFFFEQAVCGIRDYVRKCGFSSVVIGESGGIDSAVVTALAVEALGPEKVIGITMPSEFSSEGSYKDSELLCNNLHIKFFICSIKNMFKTFLGQFDSVFEKNDKMSIMKENLQARIRGQILMAYSNEFGSLVLSTGNKSELSVGYSTLYGDMCGGLSPIAGLYKMEVYGVANYFNTLKGKELIPKTIIEKAPSAELSPNQKDTDSLPEYPVLDAILKYYIEDDPESRNIENIRFINSESIKKVLSLIKKAEFKRRQSSIGLKMHYKDFGFGRRIPVAQNWEYK